MLQYRQRQARPFDERLAGSLGLGHPRGNRDGRSVWPAHDVAALVVHVVQPDYCQRLTGQRMQAVMDNDLALEMFTGGMAPTSS